jgi:hypothetical protein
MSSISPDEKAKMREKAKNTTKRIRDSMSSDEKVEMREKETIGRKRLRLAKNDLPTIISPQNDFECMNEAKNIYTGLKILKMLTKINPLYVSFATNLLLEQKRFSICQRITSVLIPKDFLWKVTKDTMRQCSFLK